MFWVIWSNGDYELTNDIPSKESFSKHENASVAFMSPSQLFSTEQIKALAEKHKEEWLTNNKE